VESNPYTIDFKGRQSFGERQRLFVSIEPDRRDKPLGRDVAMLAGVVRQRTSSRATRCSRNPSARQSNDLAFGP
jgi:hypothetical protein